MAFFSLKNKASSYIASFIESDSVSDSEEYASIDSPSIEYQDSETSKVPAHLLLIPLIHPSTILPLFNIVPSEGQFEVCIDPSTRPPHLCQSRNGEYFLRCIQETRCSLVAISSRGMFLLQESPPPPIDSILRSLVTKAESIALNTLGDFQRLCKENVNPVRGERRPISTELETEWCKISRAVNELSKRFDEVDSLYNEHGWKQQTQKLAPLFH